MSNTPEVKAETTRQESPATPAGSASTPDSKATPGTPTSSRSKRNATLTVEDYPPNTIVLAKVKGYPAWPAMVLDESLLPLNVINSRPRPPKNKSAASSATTVAVRFFSDDTYIWIRPVDLKKLTTDEIETSLAKVTADATRSSRSKKLLSLKEAYQLAQSPPDMAEFVRWGSKGEPEAIPEEEVKEEVDQDMDQDEDQDEQQDEQQDGEDVKQEPPAKKQKNSKTKATPKSAPRAKAGAASRKKAASPAKPAAATAKPKAKPKSKQEPEADPYDSDWGLDDDINDPKYKQEGNFVFEDDKQQKRFVSTFPSASTIASNFSKQQAEFGKINDQLVESLLDENIKPDVILKQLDKLQAMIKHVPQILFTKSYLYKVMILTLHKPTTKFPHIEIRAKLASILQSSVKLEVATVTQEQLDEASKDTASATPQPPASNGSGFTANSAIEV